MKEIIHHISEVGQHVNASEPDILSLFFVPVILTFIVFKAYELTIHDRKMFFPDFYGTMYTAVILSVSVSLVIFLVGENLAKAFALLGVFSILRFRNNKNSIMQLQFILISIVIGLITGSNYFILALQFAIFVSFIISLTNIINRFQKVTLEDPYSDEKKFHKPEEKPVDEA